MKNILNNIWIVYAIIFGTGFTSESVDLKETITILVIVGLIHIFIVIRSK